MPPWILVPYRGPPYHVSYMDHLVSGHCTGRHVREIGFERSPTAWSPISQGSEEIYRPRQRNLRKVRAGPRATGTTGRVMTVEMDIGFLGLELWWCWILSRAYISGSASSSATSGTSGVGYLWHRAPRAPQVPGGAHRL